MQLDENISAVITGGASGLGEATARELAKHGVKCALFDLNAEKGEAVATDINGIFCEANVTEEESVIAAFEKARAANGQERILINCAGTGIAINLVGTFRCIAHSAAGMMSLDPNTDDGGRGAVVNTASVAAEDGQIGQAAYSASKGGIVGMTLPVARDLSREGIRVNTILPGLFDTPLFEGAPDKIKQALGAQVPFPSRLGYPTEYAELARHLCENDMMNGECVRLDGAIRMAPR